MKKHASPVLCTSLYNTFNITIFLKSLHVKIYCDERAEYSKDNEISLAEIFLLAAELYYFL